MAFGNKEKLTWFSISPAQMTPEVAAAWNAYQAAKGTLQNIVAGAMAKAGTIPAGMAVKTGTGYDKLSYAFIAAKAASAAPASPFGPVTPPVQTGPAPVTPQKK